MSIKEIFQPISEDMSAVDKVIRSRLNSDVVLIRTIGEYIISAGGKRIRPAMLLMMAKAMGYEGSLHHLMAAVIEFIHTSTLLHDDVVDESDMRRGAATANAVFGNAASVLVGDYLYSRSFEMMVEADSMRIMQIMSEATTVIAEGEVLQLLNIHDSNVDFDRYMNVIKSKTAKLFEAATRVAAVLAGADKETEQQAALYGTHVGTAFQVIDDVLDYSGSAEDLGKNVGDDLREGKPTLPLIRVMQVGTPEQKALIRHAIEEGDGDFERVAEAIRSTDAIEYTKSIAKEQADIAIAALDSLAESPYKQSLKDLVTFSLARTQ
ncbi:Octaprenyl-diphosphate synthase/Dimethylallyltransferase [Taylorella asinigenitalis MCE3]|uniref:Octaprenyl diphosphate synthase n=2 Tax=Taylorella asinigenitalis TaxID=84590 RepID=G4QDH3_TAYAM|nr:octaprenyl diphosphate synthase [Taylorella asinigenitalis]AEP35990.1 Octaprenyl-diphosphate synthase/Dimethylallyltransferase [Taylorella asinigenitalis MCE3]